MTSPDPRYPIGKHQRKPNYTDSERRANIARLSAQPSELRTQAGAFAPEQLDTPYREGGWTIRQLVHHMADSHLNMYMRVKLALTEDEPTIKPYDQDAWAALSDSMTAPVEASLALFQHLHARIIAVLESLPDAGFQRGIIHLENGRMTVDEIVAMYSWHGDHHLAQLRAATGRLR